MTSENLSAELQTRVVAEKARRELLVDYYRIGHTLAFPLPLASRPQNLPAGFKEIAAYPWTTWLLWQLEERWRLLHAGWRRGDDEAGRLLQREVSALAGWSHFRGDDGNVSLITGHVAGVLAHLLADPNGWDTECFAQVSATAARLLEQDLLPWFHAHWGVVEAWTPARLHNIALISLVRGAHLARVIDHPSAPPLEERALDVVRTWQRLRLADPPHTEGAAYDGYLMDHVTEWLLSLPDAPARMDEGEAAFASLAAQWIHLALPGQPAVSAPLGDVEAEMPFWMTALLRLHLAFPQAAPFAEAAWLLRRLPVDALPAAALALLLAHRETVAADPPLPQPGMQSLANALTLRTGWEARHLLLAIGAGRSGMSHLHRDSGHIILGWRGRFWITDPGYQQYRPGAEREYTVGVSAHNAPVIDGAAQRHRALRLLSTGEETTGEHRLSLDLSACYEGLPPEAQIRRDLWLAVWDDSFCVVVCDRFDGLRLGCEIRTHWQGDGDLGWSFGDGWARLSDGERVLWIGAFPQPIRPEMLERHPGSRGPLALGHTRTLDAGRGVNWWIFYSGVAGEWTAPGVAHTDTDLHLFAPSIPAHLVLAVHG